MYNINFIEDSNHNASTFASMLVETANCCGINEERDHGNYRSLILI
jgi:hypothetical protein